MNGNESLGEGLRDLKQKADEALQWFQKTGKRELAEDLHNIFKCLPSPSSADVSEVEEFRDKFLAPYQSRHPGTPPYNFVCLINNVIWDSFEDSQVSVTPEV